MSKEFKSFYKEVGGNEGNVCLYNTRLDTYGCGCAHDCSYCYAKSLLDFRKLWDNSNPSVADIEKVKRKIAKLDPHKVTALRMGGMTDCFQPIERKERVTYETIKCLNEHGIHYLILTKSTMVAEPEYLEIFDRDLAHFQITVTCTDDDKYRELQFEKAPLPSQRIKAIETLESHGFDTCIRLSPYIPEFIDIDVLNGIKCDKVLVEFLRVNHWIREWLGDKCDLSGYTRSFHGYDHLPFDRKKEMMDRMGTAHTLTVCDFEPEYLTYWKKEFNPNPDDCCNLRR